MLYSKSDSHRVGANGESHTDVGRSEFRRDYGRLLHSPVFRRLQGKTQLFPGSESDFFRNRLTHSLEVAQIAKGIALKLNAEIELFKKYPIDLDLVEFAGLAHDLGHPPFGHNGERALDDCMKRYGGFEGNAQTLRIASIIEKKRYSEAANDHCGISNDGRECRIGLDLTCRTLASILKYDKKIPKVRNKNSELVKGYYDTEAIIVNEIKDKVGRPVNPKYPFKTIECQIMDLADDIAYSTYDLEDTMKGGFWHPFSLRAKLMADHELLDKIHKKVEKEIPNTTKKDLFKALQNIFDLGIPENDDPSVSLLAAYNHSVLVANEGKYRTGFSSNLVDNFIRGVKVTPAPGRDMKFSKVYFEDNTHLNVESLKHLSFQLMILSPRLKVVEYRGYELVKTLFETLTSKNGHLLLPEDYQLMHSRLKLKPQRMRLICDFVAGMTDRYAAEFYARLKESGASIFKPF